MLTGIRGRSSWHQPSFLPNGREKQPKKSLTRDSEKQGSKASQEEALLKCCFWANISGLKRFLADGEVLQIDK